MTFSLNVATTIGSGTVNQVRNILPPSQRGSNTDVAVGDGGHRTGKQVILANPEDLNSVDAFGIRNISVTGTATLIVGPNDNPLPRQRMVIIRNVGTGDVHIGPDSGVLTTTGFELAANTQIELPLLHNVEVWGISGGSEDVRVLIY